MKETEEIIVPEWIKKSKIGEKMGIGSRGNLDGYLKGRLGKRDRASFLERLAAVVEGFDKEWQEFKEKVDNIR